MERPRLAPCPFCGGPKVACRRVLNEAGAHAGWQVLCLPCHVRLVRIANDVQPLDRAHLAVIADWNRRLSRTPRPSHSPDLPAPCPLCGGSDIVVEHREEACHWTLPGNAETGRVQVVACRDCGLTMAGWRRVRTPRVSIRRVATVVAWNQRVTPEESPAPPDEPRVRKF